MATKRLTTTTEVIDALGGINAVAKLTGRTYGAVWNWGTFETFPTNMYLVLHAALAERGYQAPPSLWGMKEKAEPERATA